MTRGARARLLVALGACACAAVLIGCGDDDEEGPRTVTETVAETESVPTETELGTDTDGAETETLGTETSVRAVSEEQALREVTDTLRSFNRTANLGKLQQACQNHFSEAFLTRLPSERACATTLAGARGGTGKVQMVVLDYSFSFDDDDPENAQITVQIGEDTLSQNLRRVDMVFEDGAWKIDAVNTV